MVRKISQRHDQQGVGGLPFLLATLYESARLLPAGLFLQRCSLKHGRRFFFCHIGFSLYNIICGCFVTLILFLAYAFLPGVFLDLRRHTYIKLL